MEDRLFMSEAAAFLRVAPSTLRFWRMKGRGPRWYKLGKRIFYDRSDLEAFIEASRATVR